MGAVGAELQRSVLTDRVARYSAADLSVTSANFGCSNSSSSSTSPSASTVRIRAPVSISTAPCTRITGPVVDEDDALHLVVLT